MLSSRLDPDNKHEYKSWTVALGRNKDRNA